MAYVYLNLHEKGKVELAGVAVCEGVYFRLAHSWGLTISLAGSRSLLWVVRPCLWLVQKSDGGGGVDERGGERVWRLFPVYGALFSFTPNVKKALLLSYSPLF